MLAGEYAVLDGCRSLAFTVDRFLELDAQKVKAIATGWRRAFGRKLRDIH